MPKFGAHMSISGGVATAFERGRDVGCETIQLFTKNNRQWKAPPLKPKEVTRFHTLHTQTGIDPVVAHASYLINIASPKETVWQKSFDALRIEMERCDTLGIPWLVLHPGSHTGSGVEAGLAKVAQSLDRLYDEGNYQTAVALEITAGQGTNLGHEFEQLARIVEQMRYGDRIVYCFDTCHAFAAGYDLTTDEGYQQTFDAFDRLLGLDRLVVFHLNDSKGTLGSRLDRHAHIGLGEIGLGGFAQLVNDPRFSNAPMILETPKDDDMAEDRLNLRVLRGLVEGNVREADVRAWWDAFEDEIGRPYEG
nr:deoxyribonuclease IV [Ardenticatena sp.]